MKYLKQLGIVLGFCAVGECISLAIGGLLPASIIGMVLLFAFLMTGVLKLKSIEETADFFLSNMAFFFIAPSLGIIEHYKLVSGQIFQILFIIIITTYITALSVAYTVKFVSERVK